MSFGRTKIHGEGVHIDVQDTSVLKRLMFTARFAFGLSS